MPLGSIFLLHPDPPTGFEQTVQYMGLLSSFYACSVRNQAKKPNVSLCYHISLCLRDIYRVLSEYSIAAGGCYQPLPKWGPYYPAITAR